MDKYIKFILSVHQTSTYRWEKIIFILMYDVWYILAESWRWMKNNIEKGIREVLRRLIHFPKNHWINSNFVHLDQHDFFNQTDELVLEESDSNFLKFLCGEFPNEEISNSLYIYLWVGMFMEHRSLGNITEHIKFFDNIHKLQI
jgi:hypothetical protein